MRPKKYRTFRGLKISHRGRLNGGMVAYDRLFRSTPRGDTTVFRRGYYSRSFIKSLDEFEFPLGGTRWAIQRPN